MKDKVQKIREEVERLKRWNNNVRNSTRHMTLQEEDFNRGKHSSYLEILNFIDSLQEESVSDEQPSVILYGLTGSVGITKEEPVSDELEKVVEEIVEPTILNAYGVKDIANRLRRTMIEPVSEELEKVSKEWLAPQLDKSYAGYGEAKMMELTSFDGYAMLDAIEFGAKWQEKKMMAKAVDGVITFDYYGDDDKTYGCIAHDSFCLEDFGLKDTDKVKMILIKED